MALAREVATTPRHQNIRDGKDFYRAKAARVAKAAKVIVARAEREPAAPKPVLDDAIPALDWPPVTRSSDVTLCVRGLAKGFGGRPLFAGLTFDLRRGERLAVLGVNGAGKTTLLRVLLGHTAPDAGAATWARGVHPGWFAQEAEQLDAAASALDNVLVTGADPGRARLVLACLRLRGDRVLRAVGTLSAGERAQVALARLVVGGADVLLLDEPTNHLDLDAREAMEATLAGYPGAIVLVSHDERLVEGLATHRLALLGGGDVAFG
jgi:ATPase subunit of ABC transporter with duplicated ATPase domains